MPIVQFINFVCVCVYLNVRDIGIKSHKKIHQSFISHLGVEKKIKQRSYNCR